MTTSESKGRFFLLNESIRIDSHNESNRFESRIGMLYRVQHDGHGFVCFFTHTSYVRLATLCHSVAYPAAVCSSVRPSHVTAEDEYIKKSYVESMRGL